MYNVYFVFFFVYIMYFDNTFFKKLSFIHGKKPNIAKAIDRDVDASHSAVEIKIIEIAMLIARNTKLSINSIIPKKHQLHNMIIRA